MATAARLAALPRRALLLLSGRALHTRRPAASQRATNSYVQGTVDIPLLNKTVGQCLDETAERFPDREAFVFVRDGVRKTFAQFKEEVDQAAAGLLALGLKKGDRLGMWGPNKYEWVLMQFATAQAGIILVSVNPAYQALELEFVIRKVGCKALVFPTQFKSQKYYDILKQSCPELENSSPGGIKSKRLPDLSVVIVVDSKLPGTFHMNDVMQAGDSSHVKQLRALQQTLSCNEPINIQFTSGTTGSPKGATLSHRNIVNNGNLIGMRLGITEQVAYGTTENSPVTFMGFPNDSIDRKTKTVGYIFPHTEAKIEDPETGKPVPLNTAGELQIRGYCVMLGYWDDPERTREVISDDKWYKTGDIASLDEHGYCSIIGRCKDMIIRGGENIYPAELEQFLHTHPKVEEVQVVGVKDSVMGEEVCACIRLRAGQNCTVEDIKAFCKGKISHFKIPRYVVFVNQYPLTVSGKVQKYKLREQMEKHLQL
ncbi:medium-chain acyl-CoA ligase ACSF2, mitochondrial isoform X2 [Anser cygnoides]|uniref:medium-chain acyl-CoA ligase ACSF2, mitochondrial isoform X2 n=1 Tax=Anser cygnoides TaxID=8845 RepID=UPI0034D1DD45